MRLRPFHPKDAEGMLSWMKDKSINDVFATDFGSFTLEKVLKFIESANKDKSNLHLACVDDNDEYLGTVSLKAINKQDKNAEYAISFCKKAHGTGAAHYATQEILKIAFMELGLERVYLNVIPDNTRANAFYKKSGFVFEGTFRKHIQIKDQLKDLNWYSILKEEYEKTHQNF